MRGEKESSEDNRAEIRRKSKKQKTENNYATTKKKATA